jgi:hypothetical protein
MTPTRVDLPIPSYRGEYAETIRDPDDADYRDALVPGFVTRSPGAVLIEQANSSSSAKECCDAISRHSLDLRALVDSVLR